MTPGPARRVVRAQAVAAGPEQRAHRSGGTGEADLAGRARCPQSLLLALLLCGFLVVGVPILMLTTMPAAHADSWGGLSEGSSGDLTGGEVAGEVRGDPAGVQATGAPGSESSWDAEVTTLQHLRSGLEASEPTQPEPPGPASDEPAGHALLSAALTGTQPAPPDTPDRQDPRDAPLTTPNLGHLRTRDPVGDDQPEQGADDDGSGDPWPPGALVPTGRAQAGTWTLHLVLVAGAPPDSAQPDPILSSDPGGRAPVARTRDATRQPRAATTSLPPDPGGDPASLVIVGSHPGGAWAQVVAVDGLRGHPDERPPAAATRARGQPSTAASVAERPAQQLPQTTSAATPRQPVAQRDPSGVPVFDRLSPLAGQLRGGRLLESVPVVAVAAMPGPAHRHHPTILPTSFVTKAASEVHPWSRIAADADQVTRRPPSQPTASYQASTTQVGQAAGWAWDNWEYLAAVGFIGLGAVVTLTGVGGPLGVAMITGALWSVGGSIAAQKLTSGQVSWAQAVGSGMLGGALGGLGVMAGLNPVLLRIRTERLHPALLRRFPGARPVTIVGIAGNVTVRPLLKGAATIAFPGVLGGMGNRWLHGGNLLDPYGLVVDLVSSVLIGGVAGRIGARFPQTVRVTFTATPGVLRRGHTLASTDVPGSEIRLLSNLWISWSYPRTRVVLRHEMIHALVNQTATSRLAERLRLYNPETARDFLTWLYDHSQLFKYTHEAVAQTYATRSLAQGFAYPFTNDFGLSPWRLGIEAAGAGAKSAAVGYGLVRARGSTRAEPTGGDTGKK